MLYYPGIINHDMPRNAVGWFEIYVSDMERAKTFYENVFQVTLTPLPMPPGSEGMEMVAFPMHEDGPGSAGALTKMEGYGPSASGTIVYFSSTDCSIEEARVKGSGGSVLKPKESIGEYGFISLIKDCEGNIIGIHSLK